MVAFCCLFAVFFCFFVLFVCAVRNDGFLDYVQVPHQFSLAVLNSQTTSCINLEIDLQCHRDGAYEPTSATPATIGGLLVDEWGRSLEFFGLALPSSLLEQFLEFSEHPIYELELLPVLVAIKLWATFLCRSHVVFYLDNNAAHSALVRADGATPAAMGIVTEFVKFEKLLHLLPWFRVPSHSNPADDASRLSFNVP